MASRAVPTGGKPGRKPRGDRVFLAIKVPRDHKAAYQRAADQAGLTLTDYVPVVLAQHLGLPKPTYIDRENDPNQLPLRFDEPGGSTALSA